MANLAQNRASAAYLEREKDKANNAARAREQAEREKANRAAATQAQAEYVAHAKRTFLAFVTELRKETAKGLAALSRWIKP